MNTRLRLLLRRLHASNVEDAIYLWPPWVAGAMGKRYRFCLGKIGRRIWFEFQIWLVIVLPNAEKQLIAYFISKHVFLATEFGPSVDSSKPYESHQDFKGRLNEVDLDGSFEGKRPLPVLASIAPPVSLKQAYILVSSSPCRDCVLFTQLVNTRLHLKLWV